MGPVVRYFGLTFFLGSIMKLIHDIMIFIPPYLLKLIIEFVNPNDSAATWWGVTICVVLLLVTSTQSILLSQYFYRMYLIGE